MTVLQALQIALPLLGILFILEMHRGHAKKVRSLSSDIGSLMHRARESEAREETYRQQFLEEARHTDELTAELAHRGPDQQDLVDAYRKRIRVLQNRVSDLEEGYADGLLSSGRGDR